MTEIRNLSSVTIEEFDAMEREERLTYELIDGIVMMSPSPSREHQTIGNKLLFRLNLNLVNTTCQPLYEYDVRANGDVYRPDIMVFCEDNEELPRIVVEIVSPTSKRRDLVIKVAKYELAGIAEYWIADPKTKTITVHDFVNAETEIYMLGDLIKSKAVPEIIISVADIFGDVPSISFR